MNCRNHRRAIIKKLYSQEDIDHVRICQSCIDSLGASYAHLFLPDYSGTEICCCDVSGKIGKVVSCWKSQSDLQAMNDVVAHIKTCDHCSKIYNDIFVMTQINQ